MIKNLQGWKFSTAVDFACLTVHMGKNLRQLLRTDPDSLRLNYFGDLGEESDTAEPHAEGAH